jgi:hypothetical protein
MEEVRLTYQQIANYAVILNVVVSALFGLFPLLAGLRLKNSKYGIIAFVGSILTGLLGIFLSFPFAMVMQYLILRRGNAPETSEITPVDPPAHAPSHVENRAAESN